MTFTVKPLSAVGHFELSDSNKIMIYATNCYCMKTHYGYASPIYSEDLIKDIPPEWLKVLDSNEFVVDRVRNFEHYLWSQTLNASPIVPDIDKVEFEYIIYDEYSSNVYEMAIKTPGYVVTWSGKAITSQYPSKIYKTENNSDWWYDACNAFYTMRACQTIIQSIPENMHKDKKWWVSFLMSYFGKNGPDLQEKAQFYYEKYAQTGIVSWDDFLNIPDSVNDMSIIL